METVMLKGRTRKGKNRLLEAAMTVLEWNGLWSVLREADSVTFAPGVHGPWLFVAPFHVDSSFRDKHSRWVHKTNDTDFAVTPNV